MGAIASHRGRIGKVHGANATNRGSAIDVESLLSERDPSQRIRGTS